MGEHAERGLQPSSFKRTLHCPGWANLVKDVPRKESSKWAAEGSVAHELNDLCLKQNKSAFEFIGATGWHNNGRTGINSSDIAPREQKGKHHIFTIDEAMAEACQVYIDFVRGLRDRLVGCIFETEKKLDLSWIVPGMFGTGDFTAIEPLTTIYVVDYKHGAGVPVDIGSNVGDNEQTTIYALGTLGKDNPHGVSHVEATIVQPRAAYSGGVIRSVSYLVKDLYAWAYDVMKPAAEASKRPDAPLAAGPWCHWCPGAETIDEHGRVLCPEIGKQALEKVEVMFPEAVTIDEIKARAAQLPGESLDYILERMDIVKLMYEAAQAEAFSRLRAGAANAPTKFKLVQGRQGNRAWADDGAAVDALSIVVDETDLFEKKLRSPTRIEAALKKGGLKPAEVSAVIAPLLAERKAGAPTLAKIDDPRPALPPSAEQMFD